MIDFQLKKYLDGPQGKMLLEVQAQISPGTFLCLYGESGAGKSSILRMLAGLMSPQEGYIYMHKTCLFASEKQINLRPQLRQIGFLFQEYALFPNMSVRQNMTYALKKGQNKQIIEDLIEITALGDLQHRRPGTLSGGQQQRAALARTLVQQPSLLLLDEPLSALDRSMRNTIQDYLLDLHRKYELTTILVSHDVGEIIKLADQVLVLEKGKISKLATPLEVFTHRQISGKFQFTGELLEISQEDVIYVLSILIGRHLVKVVADKSEVEQLTVGDRVLLASKAFNPVIKKLE
ncbi:MAG: ATP-binding cassette domain-containing protein [Bacteroidota bacterium]